MVRPRTRVMYVPPELPQEAANLMYVSHELPQEATNPSVDYPI